MTKHPSRSGSRLWNLLLLVPFVALLTKLLRRGVSVRNAQDKGSEGPDGFYATMER